MSARIYRFPVTPLDREIAHARRLMLEAFADGDIELAGMAGEDFIGLIRRRRAEYGIDYRYGYVDDIFAGRGA